MFEIRIERVIGKSIDTVFDIFSDYEGYKRFASVKNAKIMEPGETERNGRGALRHVDLGMIKFDERITCFERPYRLDYKIVKSSPIPIRHKGGTITLIEEGDATKVVWVSRGTIAIPIIGSLLDGFFERQGNRAFGGLLKQISKLG